MPRAIFNLVLLLAAGSIAASAARAAMAPMPDFSFTPGPSSNRTQARVPKEVKEKENQTPLATCENSDPLSGEKITVANYVDGATGATTTIRRIDVPEQPRIGSPLPARTIWEIVSRQGNKPRIKITYEIDPQTHTGTRTEQIGRDEPKKTKVGADDLAVPAPAPKKQSGLPAHWAARSLARAARERSVRLAAAPRDPQPGSAQSAPAPGFAIVVKSDALGEPPEIFFAISDLTPPMSADEYVLRDALDTLDYEAQNPESAWAHGTAEPGVFYPGDSFYTQDGEHIEIVGDWSLARIPGGFVMSCGGFPMDDEDEEFAWRLPYGVKYEAIDRKKSP